MFFINHEKIVITNAFELCMKTQRTSPPLSRFLGNSLRLPGFTTNQIPLRVSFLSAKSADA